MSEKNSYWTRTTINRRAAVQGMAIAGGLAALSLSGCGGSSVSKSPSTDQPKGTAIDPTKGKPGGLLRNQSSAYPSSLNAMTAQTNAVFWGFAHAGLLEFKHGSESMGVSTTDIALRPSLATSMPEQPDELTYVFKLQDARFHNGRTVTSEDVKYSILRYRDFERSAYRSAWAWLSSIDTPDPKTVVVKGSAPFADALLQSSDRELFILAKEHEESADADKKVVGAGPFTFVETLPPLSAKFKKNPDYFMKPYPYFDEVEIYANYDDVKRFADLASGQMHATHTFNPNQVDQIKKSRPDLVFWPVFFASHSLHPRVDQAPFTDKRVRQALSMSIDRKVIREGTDAGDGTEDDQYLSYVQTAWGMKKPSELGASAKNWKFDPQAAKQLLSAAGITLPMSADVSSWNATTGSYYDTATLAVAKWRELGIANMKQSDMTQAQSASTAAVGNYDGIYLSASGIANNPVFGIRIRTEFFSPPEGVKPPTPNIGHINDRKLSDLAEKQLTQLKYEDRKASLHQIQDVLADEMYKIPFSTYVSYRLTEPALRNVQIPKYWFSGSRGFVKYWWWDKA